MDTSSDNFVNSNTPRSTGHSADYLEISDAIKSYWDIFMTLETEMKNFVPRPRIDYFQEEEQLFDRYLKEQSFLLNNYSEEEKAFAKNLSLIIIPLKPVAIKVIFIWPLFSFLSK